MVDSDSHVQSPNERAKAREGVVPDARGPARGACTTPEEEPESALPPLSDESASGIMEGN